MNILSRIFNFQFSIFKYFWRWHPEVAIRYWPIAREIKNSKLKIKNCNAKLKILELGSGWLGIAPYLREEVVGLDENFEGKKFSLLKQVKGTILEISFADNSFDFIVCVDVLEHLPKEKRSKAVEELLRMVKKKLFLAVPCGKKSYQQDKKLDEDYRRIFEKAFPFLTEHLRYGLPEKKDVIQLIKLAAKKQEKKVEIKIQGNENLHLRRFLMRGWMTKDFFIDFLFRKVFLLLIPFFGFFDKPPYYRQIFYIKIEI